MSGRNVILDVRNLRVYFPIKGGVVRKTVGYVHAVEDVSFQICEKETFGLVGESGCGKTTTGRALLRLIEPTAGRISFEGEDLCSLNKEALRKKRRDMQFVFQNPYASLNPRMTVRKLLEEPLQTHFRLTRSETDEQVRWISDAVGLAPEQMERYPHQFSGGQRQRISIARALICKPRFVVADEPVSALDVSIQSQILNLLMNLQKDMNLSYLFISHDLNVVRHISDRMGVMYLGRIVESGNTEDVYHHPLHPYTQALLSAIPKRDPSEKKDRIHLEGDVPNPANPPSGCAFRERCPKRMEICSRLLPETRELEPGHCVACHLYGPGKNGSGDCGLKETKGEKLR
jgi:oligopeptide/dipeptide ABC transporter ATP-binding protein